MDHPLGVLPVTEWYIVRNRGLMVDCRMSRPNNRGAIQEDAL